MRIIAGRLGGRKLINFNGSHIRPMTDKVKESLFNILQSRWNDAQILDAFSGTGNLGLEAFSRGANSVIFLDLDSKSTKIIKKNIEQLGLSSEKSLKVLKQDFFKFCLVDKNRFDIIFCDPPFPKSFCSNILQSISQSLILKPKGLLVIEHPKDEDLGMIPENLEIYKQKDFGQHQLTILEKTVDL